MDVRVFFFFLLCFWLSSHCNELIYFSLNKFYWYKCVHFYHTYIISYVKMLASALAKHFVILSTYWCIFFFQQISRNHLLYVSTAPHSLSKVNCENFCLANVNPAASPQIKHKRMQKERKAKQKSWMNINNYALSLW